MGRTGHKPATGSVVALNVVLPALLSNGIDDFNPGKVPLIVSDNDAVIGVGDRRDNCIEGAARLSSGGSFSHQPHPDQPGLLVEWQNTT